MPSTTIAFLGPEGTFAHLVAKKRFGSRAQFVPAMTIDEVFAFVAKNRHSRGIVPIENSSGGTIYETVDKLVDFNSRLVVQEALSMNVRLALLGKDRQKIEVIYSHFAPLHHCKTWLQKNFPNVKRVALDSTATAVKKAVTQDNAAAIGRRDAARRYGLKVLEFPIEQDAVNVTQFFVLGHDQSRAKENSRTSVIFTLPNHAGSLYDFLTPFKNEGVNLSRIISRPIAGKPDTYVFLADLAGTASQQNVKAALKKAAAVASYMRNIGSYPVRSPYNS